MVQHLLGTTGVDVSAVPCITLCKYISCQVVSSAQHWFRVLPSSSSTQSVPHCTVLVVVSQFATDHNTVVLFTWYVITCIVGGKFLIQGVKINTPHYLAKMEGILKGTSTYTVIVSQLESLSTIYYTLRVCVVWCFMQLTCFLLVFI